MSKTQEINASQSKNAANARKKKSRPAQRCIQPRSLVENKQTKQPQTKQTRKQVRQLNPAQNLKYFKNTIFVAMCLQIVDSSNILLQKKKKTGVRTHPPGLEIGDNKQYIVKTKGVLLLSFSSKKKKQTKQAFDQT